jgi:hypothetical protein
MVNKKKNSGGKGRKKKAESEEESYSDDDDDDSATSFTSHLSLGKAGGNSGLKPPSLNTSTVSMTTTGKVPYGCRLKPPSLSTSTVSMTTTGFVPYDHHMHVLTIGRGSPGTGNDGFFQDSLLTSGLKVIIERFFKGGHTIIPIKFAPEQSGYGIDQSQTLLDVYNYVYKNPSHHIIVIATDSTRFGRDLYNIRYFMNYVHSANPNVQFTTIKEFGLYLDQSAQLVEKWGMDRHKSYDDYKKLSEELEQTSEEKMIESAIKERVRELKDNSGELRRLRSHISTALDEGMVATLQHEAVVGVILRSSDFSTDERLRALVGLFEEGTKKVGDVECYRASNYSETDGKLIVKVDMVPVDQSIFVAATKIVLKITTQTKWIIFDNRVNRNRIGKGTIKLFSLIAAGKVKTVFIKSHERFQSFLVPLLVVLCEIRGTRIVFGKHFGKDFKMLAQLELLRKEALRETGKDLEEGIALCRENWNQLTRDTHDDLQKLRTCGLGTRIQEGMKKNRMKKKG